MSAIAVWPLTVLQIIVVVWSKDISWDDRREVAPVLIVVESVLHVYHALSIGITL